MMARKLCYFFRFVEVFDTINDGGIFESSFRDIYPGDLELDRENGKNA